MTSVLNVDTIADKAGTGPVALTKQSAAKAWVQYNTSHVVQDSQNVSSVTDVGTGQGTINVSNSLSNSGYSVNYSSGITGPAVNGLRISAMATSSYSTQQVNNSGSYTDSDFCCTTAHGDLA